MRIIRPNALPPPTALIIAQREIVRGIAGEISDVTPERADVARAVTRASVRAVIQRRRMAARRRLITL